MIEIENSWDEKECLGMKEQGEFVVKKRLGMSSKKLGD
jgi:hypothetical protein